MLITIEPYGTIWIKNLQSYFNIVYPLVCNTVTRLCRALFRHDLKSIGTRNLYLGPLHIIDRIHESVMIFKSPVTI